MGLTDQLTDPRSHDPGDFRYLTHTFTNGMSRTDFSDEQKLTHLASLTRPDCVKGNVQDSIISCCLSSPRIRPFGNLGILVEVPESQVLAASADLRKPTNEDEAGFFSWLSTVGGRIESKKELESYEPYFNEVLVQGPIEMKGVFYCEYASKGKRDKRYDHELREEAYNLQRLLADGLPVVKLAYPPLDQDKAGKLIDTWFGKGAELSAERARGFNFMIHNKKAHFRSDIDADTVTYRVSFEGEPGVLVESFKRDAPTPKSDTAPFYAREPYPHRKAALSRLFDQIGAYRIKP